MKTTTEIEKSNSLKFTTSKIVNKIEITVKIRLNDECKNGHQDFSITGDIYKAGVPRNNRSFVSGGCIHEEIAKCFPEFKQFIKLHLCDYEGIPMHAGANGFYHLENGFNNTKPDNAKFKSEFCEYYRVTSEQFESLKESKNVLQYSVKLQTLGILKQWKKEAKEAIKELEKLTGTKFLIDSKRTQFVAPAKEELKEEDDKQKAGYYTKEAELQREKDAFNLIVTNLTIDKEKIVLKAEHELKIKLMVLYAGGKKALDNMIFYNHTNEIAFNWRGYGDKMSQEEIDTITKKMDLPEGVTVKNSGK